MSACHLSKAFLKSPAPSKSSWTVVRSKPPSTTMLGLPCAHRNGKLQFANRLTRTLHFSIESTSLNMMALLHARELSISIRPLGQLEILDSHCFSPPSEDCELHSQKSGPSLENSSLLLTNPFSALVQISLRRRLIKILGSKRQRSAIKFGNTVTTTLTLPSDCTLIGRLLDLGEANQRSPSRCPSCVS